MPGGHADCNWERSAVFSPRDRKSSEGTRALAAYFCSTKALRRSADNPEEVPSSEPNALLNIRRFCKGLSRGDGAEKKTLVAPSATCTLRRALSIGSTIAEQRVPPPAHHALRCRVDMRPRRALDRIHCLQPCTASYVTSTAPRSVPSKTCAVQAPEGRSFYRSADSQERRREEFKAESECSTNTLPPTPPPR